MNAVPIIRLLQPEDAAVFDRIAPEVFDFAVRPELVAEFLRDPRHHMAVALAEQQLIGMASAVHYVHPDKPTELWINEVAVTPAYQDRGIGRQLLQALFARGRELGCVEAWVGTDHTNIAARRMYAAVGGKEQSILYVTFSLDDRPNNGDRA